MAEEFEIKKFNLDEIDVRAEASKYPFERLEVGEGFTVAKEGPSISGRVSAENKKGDRVYVSRKAKPLEDGTPQTNVIRVK